MNGRSEQAKKDLEKSETFESSSTRSEALRERALINAVLALVQEVEGLHDDLNGIIGAIRGEK